MSDVKGTLFERWADKILIGDDCWAWTGKKNDLGYGRIKVGGIEKYAHRVGYELMVGPIPEGKMVCHKCDNPGCVKPSHLFLGTQGDNMRDAARKGRVRRGERHCRAKLTEKDVLAIRAFLGAGESQQVLASIYDIDQSGISHIGSGQSWAWLPEGGDCDV